MSAEGKDKENVAGAAGKEELRMQRLVEEKDSEEPSEVAS